jgi:hypothetical protein
MVNKDKSLQKFKIAKIEAARKRLDKSCRGTDKEYYSHLLAADEELKTLSLQRRGLCAADIQDTRN